MAAKVITKQDVIVIGVITAFAPRATSRGLTILYEYEKKTPKDKRTACTARIKLPGKRFMLDLVMWGGEWTPYRLYSLPNDPDGTIPTGLYTIAQNREGYVFGRQDVAS